MTSLFSAVSQNADTNKMIEQAMPDISVEVAALSISSPQYSSDLACIDMDSNAETVLEHCFMARTKKLLSLLSLSWIISKRIE